MGKWLAFAAVLPVMTATAAQAQMKGLAPADVASVARSRSLDFSLLVDRIEAKGLWHLIKRITNIYGEGGVGMRFDAWPMIESTLRRRRDFTRLMANHKDTTGGFYEKERGDAVLHFLYQEGEPRTWYVHFDLYSPIHSPGSALKHLRHEFLGKVTPNWEMIAKHLNNG